MVDHVCQKKSDTRKSHDSQLQVCISVWEDLKVECPRAPRWNILPAECQQPKAKNATALVETLGRGEVSNEVMVERGFRDGVYVTCTESKATYVVNLGTDLKHVDLVGDANQEDKLTITRAALIREYKIQKEVVVKV